MMKIWCNFVKFLILQILTASAETSYFKEICIIYYTPAAPKIWARNFYFGFPGIQHLKLISRTNIKRRRVQELCRDTIKNVKLFRNSRMKIIHVKSLKIDYYVFSLYITKLYSVVLKTEESYNPQIIQIAIIPFFFNQCIILRSLGGGARCRWLMQVGKNFIAKVLLSSLRSYAIFFRASSILELSEQTFFDFNTRRGRGTKSLNFTFLSSVCLIVFMFLSFLLLLTL